MRKRTGLYPAVQVVRGHGVWGRVASRRVALLETAKVSGLDRALSAGLERWRAPRAVHDPAKVRDLGLNGVRRGKKVRTTVPDPDAKPEDRPSDLLERDVTAAEPNQRWVADFT